MSLTMASSNLFNRRANKAMTVMGSPHDYRRADHRRGSTSSDASDMSKSSDMSDAMSDEDAAFLLLSLSE